MTDEYKATDDGLLEEVQAIRGNVRLPTFLFVGIRLVVLVAYLLNILAVPAQ